LDLATAPPPSYRCVVAAASRTGRQVTQSLGARVLTPALAVLALSQLLLAAWMVVDPGTFFDNVGGFGPRNDHYIRDVATWAAALGVAAAIAVGRTSWRVPVLGLAVVQFALHAVNHVADAGGARGATSGWANAIELSVSTVVLCLLLRVAVREKRH